MGPTASGKTDLALKICQRFPCEIISVDSVMVYRGMDIGSAKPDKILLREHPHHLIDILDPASVYSVANFRADALRLMREIHQRGNIPLLVGGTMLYFGRLQHGLSQIPGANPLIRKRLDACAREKGWAFMHAQLAKIDPRSATRIHSNDPQRIQRALEVYELTGIPISIWHERSTDRELPFRALKLALIPHDRQKLHKRIEQRFEAMLSAGFLCEAKVLYQREDIHADLPSMRAVGYRQAWKYFDGDFDFVTMRTKAVIATRQFAKRQLTWLRGETGLTSFLAERYDIDDIYRIIHSHME